MVATQPIGAHTKLFPVPSIDLEFWDAIRIP